jgi:hypothetical protein
VDILQGSVDDVWLICDGLQAIHALDSNNGGH